VRADAVADEVRRVLADDDALAERVLAKATHMLEHARRRVLARHELQELHVPDGVEEVHDEEALLEGVAAPLEHLGDAEPGGVRRDDRVRGHDALQLREQRALRLDLLDDGLDDEVDVLQAIEVVLDVARRDELRVALVKERRRARLERLLEPSRGEAIARGAAALLGLGQVRRDDVEQQHFDAGVREVGGDAAAHDACADDGCASDGLVHAVFSSGWRAPSWARSPASTTEICAGGRDGRSRGAHVRFRSALSLDPSLLSSGEDALGGDRAGRDAQG
jgi:hypothetical protein